MANPCSSAACASYRSVPSTGGRRARTRAAAGRGACIADRNAGRSGRRAHAAKRRWRGRAIWRSASVLPQPTPPSRVPRGRVRDTPLKRPCTCLRPSPVSDIVGLLSLQSYPTLVQEVPKFICAASLLAGRSRPQVPAHNGRVQDFLRAERAPFHVGDSVDRDTQSVQLQHRFVIASVRGQPLTSP